MSAGLDGGTQCESFALLSLSDPSFPLISISLLQSCRSSLRSLYSVLVVTLFRCRSGGSFVSLSFWHDSD